MLLQAGYAVIFLNRKHSIQPFTKGLPSGEIMECLTEMLDNPNQTGKDGRAIIKQAAVLAAGVHRQGVLLRITFETLFEYLKVRWLYDVDLGQIGTVTWAVL